MTETATVVREWGLRSSTGAAAQWPSEQSARDRRDAFPLAVVLVSRVPGGPWEVER